MIKVIFLFYVHGFNDTVAQFAAVSEVDQLNAHVLSLSAFVMSLLLF